MKTAVLALAAAAVASAAGAVTVPNGDFSAGNTGFTSDYGYGPNQGDLLNEGEGFYTVANDAQFAHPSFTSFGDHTTGTGLYLIANGATQPGSTVYRSASIAVRMGATYTFGAFLANAYDGNNADIDFLVASGNGPAVSVGTYTIPAGSGVWNGTGYTFVATAPSVVLSLVDLNLASGGNDFAVDDITLAGPSAVPEAATWAMMIAGFGLVGLGLRRRALVAA